MTDPISVVSKVIFLYEFIFGIVSVYIVCGLPVVKLYSRILCRFMWSGSDAELSP